MNIKRPDISLIITTHNRAALLDATLARFANLDTRDFRWELIVVDNGCTDDTQAVLDRHSQVLPLVRLNEPRPGKTRAQNRALDAAHGALIVLSDDDVVADVGWLDAFYRAAERWPDISIFGGQIDPVLEKPAPDWLSKSGAQEQLVRRFSYYRPRADEGHTDIYPLGPNTAIRFASLHDIRFDETLGPDGTSQYVSSGDTAFIKALVDQGESIVFVPDARIDHVVRPAQLELRSLNQRAFRRGMKNAVFDTQRYRGLSVCGAPLRLWASVLRLRLRVLLRYPLGKQYRVALENRLAFRRGFLHQRRLSNRRSRAGD